MSRRKSRKISLQILGLIILLVALGLGYGQRSHPNNNPTSQQLPNTEARAGSLSLIAEPDAGTLPVLKLINGAKRSVDLVMYELKDPQVEQALSSAEARGVSVRVLLNGGYYGRPDKTNPNQAAYDYLLTHNVLVRWTPSHFALTHQKTLVVDSRKALIMTFNLTPQYYATSRDFGITDTDAKDVVAIEATFDADWQNREVTALSGDDLLWSPDSEAATINFINSAKTSLKIYNEEMADSKIVAALGQAALRGVNVQIVMTDQSGWHTNFVRLEADGVQIRTFAPNAPLYIHAKMILADNSRMFIGSENFSTTSLERNRELGIITGDRRIIASANHTFSADFANATPY